MLVETPYVHLNLRIEYVVLVAISADFTTENGVTSMLYVYLMIELFQKYYLVYFDTKDIISQKTYGDNF